MLRGLTQFIVATAGHVDHGKSALIKALTGTDPDRLPEEKARGITIDLGFARLMLPGTGPPPSGFDLGIVDVPGHEDFVANMVSGAGAIDLALLVIAADDGWMPQTEEHVQILTYLGVTRAVVVLTKVDLVPNDEETVRVAIGERLRGTPFTHAPIVSTSVISGRGLGDLRAALVRVLSEIPPPRDIGKPRLAVDRAFTLRGIGTIVTGTVVGGAFQRGQAVVLQPSGLAARIRTLQSHNEAIDSVGPGRRAALGLPDVAVARKGSVDAGDRTVRRGQVVTVPELGATADTLDVLLQRSPRPIKAQSGPPRPLKDGARVRVHHGTANAPGHLVLFNQVQIGPGESAVAQLRLDSPVFALTGDRLIVRDWAEQTTLAGGIVLDPRASRLEFRTPKQQSFLRAQSLALNDASAALQAWLERHPIGSRDGLLARTQFGAAEIDRAVGQLVSESKLVVVGTLVAEAKFWKRLREQAIDAIETHHRLHPEQPGLPLTQFRSALAFDTPGIDVADVVVPLISDLCKAGFIQAGSVIKRANYWPALPPELSAAGDHLRRTLAAKPMDPPSRKELESSPASRKALGFLLAAGQAIEIGAELVLLAEHYHAAMDSIKTFLAGGRAATVSELKQVIGASRRVAVPFLEKLDREGVTQRRGDVRLLRC